MFKSDSAVAPLSSGLFRMQDALAVRSGGFEVGFSNLNVPFTLRTSGSAGQPSLHLEFDRDLKWFC
jgi:hypothetical protein